MSVYHFLTETTKTKAEDVDAEPRTISSGVWKDLELDFEKNKEEVERFKKSQQTTCEEVDNPYLKYLEDKIFFLLDFILEHTMITAKECKSLRYHKSPFHGLDFISELLWNLNPAQPKRRENWTYIHDMDWVKQLLEEKPRPFFPFSWIWTRNHAATVISAYMRGYWVRRMDEVQEMRQFWKTLEREKRGSVISQLPSIMLPTLPFYEKKREERRKEKEEEIYNLSPF